MRKAKGAPKTGRAAVRDAARVIPSPSSPRNTIEVTKFRGAYNAFGYKSARILDRDGQTASPGSGDSHANLDRERLVTQARDFARNNGIFSGMLERASSYIVGNGFTIQAKTEDRDWNADAEAYWKAFWRRPEIRGLVSGRGLERIICKELLTCGDVGVIKTDREKLQVVEAEQIKGKANANDDGIVKDDVGAPTQFMVSPWGKNGGPETSKAKGYSPEHFLFVARTERASASRGVPPCQAAFPMLHRINDVCDSEAIAWQLLARIAISINRTGATSIAYGTSAEDETKSGEDLDGDFATRVHELDQALIFHGEKGEEVKAIERNLPGKDFPASVTMFLRLLGLPLGLPLEVILLDWTKSNYSQSRAVLEQAYVAFRGWQFLLEDFFYVPVYEWVIDRAIRSGALKSRPDSGAHEWIKPTFPWIDQLQEAEAYSKKLDRGFCTQAQVLKSLNADREDVVGARQKEIEDAIARSKELEKKTGEKVPWQLFAGLEVPQAAPAPARPADDGADEEEEEKDEEPAPGARAVEKVVVRDARGNIVRVIEKPYVEGTTT